MAFRNTTDHVYRVSNTTDQAYQASNDSVSTPGEMSLLDKLFLLSDDQRRLAASIQEPLKAALIAIMTPLMVCNLVVFSQKSNRSASAYYIIGLNCGQLIYVVSAAVYLVWSQFVVPIYSSYPHCVWTIYAFIHIGDLLAKRSSKVIICLASAERLYAVLRPLHIKNFLLAKHPVLCMAVVCVLTALIHIYNLTRSKMIMVFFPSMGISLCKVVNTDFYYRNQALTDFVGTFARSTYEYASHCVQLLLNVLTIWALRRHNTATKHVQSSTNEDAKRQQERQLTIILVGASVSYFICSLPAAVFSVAVTDPDTKLGPYGKYKNLHFILSDFTFNMTVFGSGVDFFCFLGLSSKYRATLKRLLQCGDGNRFSYCGQLCQTRATVEKRVTDSSKTEISSMETEQQS